MIGNFKVGLSDIFHPESMTFEVHFSVLYMISTRKSKYDNDNDSDSDLSM